MYSCGRLARTKRGQISTEIMYAVGVMLIIFLILSGISFEQRRDLKDLEEYLSRRNECLKLANTLNEVWVATEYAEADIFLRHVTTVYWQGGVIIVAGKPVASSGPTATTGDASCVYIAYVNGTIGIPAALSFQGNVHIANFKGNVTILQR